MQIGKLQILLERIQIKVLVEDILLVERMKVILFFLFLTYSCSFSFSQKIIAETKGANSPIIFAASVSIAYGIPSQIIDSMLVIFEKEGLSDSLRRERIVQLISTITNAKIVDQLNKKDDQETLLDSLGLFAPQKVIHLLTEGDNSFIAVVKKRAKVDYGISAKAFWGLYEVLAQKEGDLQNWNSKFSDLLRRYDRLNKSLATRTDSLAKAAKLKLEEGDLDAAEAILASRWKKAKDHTQTTILKSDTAHIEYVKGLVITISDKIIRTLRDSMSGEPKWYIISNEYQFEDSFSMNNDIRNAEELLYWPPDVQSEMLVSLEVGNTHFLNHHYEDAIEAYLRSVDLYEGNSIGNSLEVASLYNNLSVSYFHIENYSEAISILNRYLTKDNQESLIDNFHRNIMIFNLGRLYVATEDYQMARNYLEKIYD